MDKFQDNGYTFEEMKMINETKKSCICRSWKWSRHVSDCRLKQGTSESVYIELDRDDATVEDIKQL
ncbi:Asd/ArgC dimerization domain-containing protein [Bacillus velezensis]|nr:Asd/ArgC dimerization domain-containing protein [Bacillus velezensis]